MGRERGKTYRHEFKKKREKGEVSLPVNEDSKNGRKARATPGASQRARERRERESFVYWSESFGSDNTSTNPPPMKGFAQQTLSMQIEAAAMGMAATARER